MKVFYPLSLKVSLWLLLNLLLLAVIAVGFFVAQGGAGWDSLVRGPAGRRTQELGNVIVGEFFAAQGSARDAVLKRFGTAYGAEFTLFHREAGPPRGEIPAEVTARLNERPPNRRPGPPDEFGSSGGRGDGPPMARSEGRGPGGPGGRGGRGNPAGPGGPEAGGPPAPDGPGANVSRATEEARGRFLVHTATPSAYWLGARVLVDGRGPPAVLVVRVDSWWGVMRLLDLQPWLLAASVVVLFSVLFWLPLVHGITRDLRLLTTATEKIADGKFDVRVGAKRRDEIGRLGESVNSMAARLDTLVNGQKRFLGDVAHELGSPLARLQVAVEILETHTAPAQQAQVADIREEVQQMTALVNELLAFTKAGLRPRAAELATVDLSALAQDVIARENAFGRVTVDIPAGLTARADAPLLTRALANLVRNAMRYAGDASPIALAARAESGAVIVTVDDEGPGVPPEALARLGEPFYRPESARTRETGGVGLGLAIVRSGVAACGGDVLFTNRTPRGFRAEVRLSAA